MSSSPWFQKLSKLFSRRPGEKPARPRKRPTTKLFLEPLEERLAPANVEVMVTSSDIEDENSGNDFTYEFTRDDTTGSLTVNFSVGGPARFGTDYTQTGATSFSLTMGSVTFGAGDDTATVTITPTGDDIVELDETIVLTLIDDPSYDLGANSVATVTIQNDDTAEITIDNAGDVTEGGTLSFTVRMTNPVDIDLTATRATSNGTATTADSDYTPLNSSITLFAAGANLQSLTIVSRWCNRSLHHISEERRVV